MSSIPAGWYPDPTNPLQERLWDGDEWMEKTRPRQPQVGPTPSDLGSASYTPMYSPAAEPERSTFGGAVREGFSKFADFDGRSSVGAYWNFWLFSVVATIGSALLLGPLAVLVFILFLFPSLSFAVRRLHDRGKSGAYLLLNFLPIIGTLIVLIELASSGEAGPNQYGQQPGAVGAVGSPVGVTQPAIGPAAQTPGLVMTAGIVLYDTGVPGDPNRYLEVAPMGWNRTPDDPKMTWREAVDFLREDQNAQLSGWRLPTTTELEWFKQLRTAIPGLSKDYYWSSSVVDGEWAEAMDLMFASIGALGTFPKHSRHRVRPVRSYSTPEAVAR